MTISELYKKSADRGVLKAGMTEQQFRDNISTEEGLRSYYDYATTTGGMKFHNYDVFKERIGWDKEFNAQPTTQTATTDSVATAPQVPTMPVGAAADNTDAAVAMLLNNNRKQQEQDKKERARINNAQLPMSENDLQREKDLKQLDERIVADAYSRNPYAQQLLPKEMREQMLSGQEDNIEGLREARALLQKDRKAYMDEPETVEEARENWTNAWIENTEEGKQAKREADEGYQQAVDYLRNDFAKSKTHQDIVADVQKKYNSGALTYDEANAELNKRLNDAFIAENKEILEAEYKTLYGGLAERAYKADNGWLKKQEERIGTIAVQEAIDEGVDELNEAMRADYEAFSKTVGNGFGSAQAKSNYINTQQAGILGAASQLYQETETILESTVKGEEKFGTLTSEILRHSKDKLANLASFGMSDVNYSAYQAEVLKKIANAGAYDNPESVLDRNEQVLYNAIVSNVAAQLLRAENTSHLANAGKLTADMLPFVRDIIMGKGLLGGFSAAAEKGIMRGIVRSIGTGKWGKLLANLGKTGVGLVESTAISLISPSTYQQVFKEEAQIDPTSLHLTDEGWKVDKIDTKHAIDAFAAAHVGMTKELFTETGGMTQFAIRLAQASPLGKYLRKTKIGQIAQMFDNTIAGKLFNQTAYHGFAAELSEEWENTFYDAVFAAMNKDNAGKRMEAFGKVYGEFVKPETQVPMLISFALPAIFGGAVSTGQIITINSQYKQAYENLRNTYMKYGATEEEFEDALNELRAARMNMNIEDYPQLINGLAATLSGGSQEQADEFAAALSAYTVADANLGAIQEKHAKKQRQVQQLIRDIQASEERITSNTHTDSGMMYHVNVNGQPGYVVSGGLQLNTYDNAELPVAVNSDIVTVRMEDGSVKQVAARDVQLLEQPQAAEGAMAFERRRLTARMNNLDRFKVGDVIYMTENGQPIDGNSSRVVDVTDEGVVAEIIDPNGQPNTTVIPHEVAESGLSTSDELVEDGVESVVLEMNNGLLIIMRKTTSGDWMQVAPKDDSMTLWSQKDLDEFIAEGGAKIVNGEQAPSLDVASGNGVVSEETGEIEQPIGQPQAEQPAKPYATDEQGNPAWAELDVEQSVGALLSEMEDDKELSKQFAQSQIAAAKSALNKANKRKPQATTDLAAFRAEAQAIKQEQQAAQAELSKWENILLGIANYKTAEEQAAEEQAAAQAAAVRAQRKQTIEGVGGTNMAERLAASPRIDGNAGSITAADGTKIPGHYVLVSANALTPSHNPNANFAQSEGYPTVDGQSINDRDYQADQEEQAKVQQVAQTYDGRAITNMPIVSDEGLVYSGNGRTMAGQLAAANGTDGAYTEALLENATQFGFTAEQVESVPNARVVFMTDERLPYNTTTLALFNQNEQQTQSNTASAAANVRKLTPEAVGHIIAAVQEFDTVDAFFGDSRAPFELVNRLIADGIISERDKAAFVDNGRLTATGKDRLTALLFGTAFDEKTIRLLGDNAKVRNSVMRALPQILENKGLGDFSLFEHINNAIQAIYDMDTNKMSFFEFTRQIDIEGKTASDKYTAFELLLVDEMVNGGVQAFRDVLSGYNARAKESAGGQLDMFTGEVLTTEELTKQILQEYEQREANERGGTQSESAVAGTSESEKTITDSVASEIIEQITAEAEEFEDIELTPNNWVKLFGEDGIVNTPIGNVKMGEGQFLKLMQKGRDTKLGMIKPTLERPSIIIEDKSKAKEGQKTEREYSYVFVKAFTGKDGERMYYFTSVTVQKDNQEVVVSNQEKERSRIMRLLKEGKLTYINQATLPSDTDISAQGDQLTNPVGGVSADEGTKNVPATQEKKQKSVEEQQKIGKGVEKAIENIEKQIQLEQKYRGEEKDASHPTVVNIAEVENAIKTLSIEELEELGQAIPNIFSYDKNDEQYKGVDMEGLREDIELFIKWAKESLQSSSVTNRETTERTPRENAETTPAQKNVSSEKKASNKTEKTQGSVQNFAQLEQKSVETEQKNAKSNEKTQNVGKNTQEAAMRIAKAEADMQEFASKLGAQGVHLISDKEQLPKEEGAAYRAIRNGANVMGWYNPKTNQVYIYLPNANNLQEVYKTLLHEFVAHKGLRDMLGKEKFDQLCHDVWDMMSEQDKLQYALYVKNNTAVGSKAMQELIDGMTEEEKAALLSDTKLQLAAADEYMAHFAETGVSEQDRSIWQRIVDAVRDLLRKAGINLRLTDADIARLLYESSSQLSSDMTMRERSLLIAKNNKVVENIGNLNLKARLNDDVMFKLGTQVVPMGDNTLVGLHNLSATKLRKAIKQGGLANPSAAVIDIAKQDHEQYGEISLVMPSSLVDSVTGQNAGTYTGDIWSPTYPYIERKMNSKGTDKYYETINKVFENAPVGIKNRIQVIFENMLDNQGDPDNLAYWYMLEKGIAPTDVIINSGISDDVKQRFEPLRDKHFVSDMNAEERGLLLSLAAELEGKTTEDLLQEAQEAKARYEAVLANEKASGFSKRIATEAIDEIDTYGVRFNLLSETLRKINEAIDKDGGVDVNASIWAAVNYVQENGLKDDFDSWLDNLDNRFGIEEVIFDGYNRNGDRKYIKHTLENASRIMNQQPIQNASSHGGLSATRGQLVERMSTLAQIRANKHRLAVINEYEDEQWKAMKDEWFNKIINPLSNMQQIDSNHFINMDIAEQRLLEAIMKKDPIAHLNREYGYSIAKDSEFAKSLKDLMQRLKELPSKYFETKFKRPVYLNEFVSAVVPQNLPQDLKDGLANAGLELYEYDEAQDGSRREATLQATESDDVRFSIKNNEDNLHNSKKNSTFESRFQLGHSVIDIEDEWSKIAIESQRESMPKTALWHEGIGDVIIHTNLPAIKAKYSELHAKAKAGDVVAARELVRAVVKRERVKELAERFPNAIVAFPHAEEASGKNKIPAAYAAAFATEGLEVAEDIIQSVKPHHTGSDKISRFVRRARYDGEVVSGREYIIVDDHVTMGGTLRDLKDYIESKGGKVVAVSTITASAGGTKLVPDAEQINALQQAGITNEQLINLGIADNVYGITKSEARELLVLSNKRGAGRTPQRSSRYFAVVPKTSHLGLTHNSEQISSSEVATNEDATRFRISNDRQRIFVSNAEKAVEGIKQEKATPQQWLAMLEKNGGIKAGEDKWLGLSEWLKEQDKKSITKQEILDFISENQIQIEEVTYSAEPKDEVFEEYKNEYRGYYFEAQDNGAESPQDVAWERMIKEHGEDFGLGFWAYGPELQVEEDSDYTNWEYENQTNERPINETRLDYTTKGLENKREIALTVPTIESWNEGDKVHFGDAGDGRAVAWVRFGETSIPTENNPKTKEFLDAEEERKNFSRKMMAKYGLTYTERDMSRDELQQDLEITKRIRQLKDAQEKIKVLVIDEIQSKRHQEGREKGYKGSFDKAALEQARKESAEYSTYLYEKYIKGKRKGEDFLDYATEEEKAKFRELSDKVAEINKVRYHGIPDAPFDKNWHELAMKRMLRYAAENGYDYVAWTTGAQQAERYDLGSVVDHVDAGISVDGQRMTDIYYRYSNNPTVVYHEEDGTITKVSGKNAEHFQNAKNISDIIGKELSIKILSQTDRGLDSIVTYQGLELSVGGEGMKGFYDRMLPSFVSKYTKKWGAKVQDINLPNLEISAQTMHAVNVTESMKEDVMEGQPMFRISEEENRTPLTEAQQLIFDGLAEVAADAGIDIVEVSEEEAKKAVENTADAESAIVDREGNAIGDGSVHAEYDIREDLLKKYPQISYHVSKSSNSESVYVTYENTDPKYSAWDRPKVTLRFSWHNNNAVRFGDQLNGYAALDAEILYRLGLAKRVFVPTKQKHISRRYVSKKDIASGKYEVADKTFEELFALPVGTDISAYQNKVAKDSNILILGDKVGEYTDQNYRRYEYAELLTNPITGKILGYAQGGTIYLTKAGMTPETVVHEYTHVWAKAMQRNNRAGWENIKEIFKQSPLWDVVVNDPNYEGRLTSDDAICSEVLARFNGKRGAEQLDEVAREFIAEEREKGGNLGAARVRKFINRAKQAISSFWKWVGKNLFGITKFDSMENVADRVLYDLLNATKLDVDINDKTIEADIERPSPEFVNAMRAWYDANPYPIYTEGESLGAFSDRLTAWKEARDAYRAELWRKSQEKIEDADPITEPMAAGSKPVRKKDETALEYAQRLKQWQNAQIDSQLSEEYTAEMNRLAGRLERAKHALVDAALPIEEWQNWLIERGATMTSESNAYQDMFLAQGRVSNAAEELRRDVIQKLTRKIAAIIESKKLDDVDLRWHNMDVPGTKRTINGNKLSVRELIGVYCQAKDCEEAEEKGLPDRGKAGFKNNLDVEYTDIVNAVETRLSREDINELWHLINQATKYALDYDLEAGRISQDTYDEFADRAYYVPQRGWRERDESGLIEEYEPVGKRGHDPYNAALVKARGRQSLAADPFAYIMSIDHSSIVSSENNKIKQKMLQFCLDNEEIGLKTGAFRVKKYWLIHEIDPDTGKIRKDEDGVPITLMSYTEPKAEDFKHDKQVKNEVKRIEKEIAKRKKALEKELAEHGDTNYAKALQRAIANSEAKIEDLNDTLIIAFGATNTHISQRTRDEKLQHEVQVMKDGQRYVIELQDEKVANAINKKFKQHQEALFNVSDKMRNATRFMSAMLTQYNPEFAASNFVRDFQVAVMTLANENPKLLPAFLKNFAVCQRAVMAYAFADKIQDRTKYVDSDMGRLLEEYMKSGAPTGFSYMQDLKTLRKDFDSMVNEGKLSRGVRSAAGIFSMFTEISETAVRFSAYAAARKSGWAINDAAYMSKELTTNFDRAGEMADSGWMSWFSFMRATINGNVKFFRAFKKFPIAYSITAAVYFAMGLINQFANPNDPEDEVLASDYTRETNFVIGKWRIPAAHFMRIFYSAGVNMTSWMQGERTFGHAAYNSSMSAFNEILPNYMNIPGAFTEWSDEMERVKAKDPKAVIRELAPTPISPFVDVWANRNFMGGTINREPFIKTQENTKDILMAKDNTLPIYRAITEEIYTAVGGDLNSKYKSDDNAWTALFDVSGSSLEHITEGYLTGGMDMLATTANMIYDAVQGNELTPDKITFIRKYYNPYTPQRAYDQQYWLLKGRVQEYQRKLNDYEENNPNKYGLETRSKQYKAYEETNELIWEKVENPTTEDVKRLIEANKKWGQARAFISAPKSVQEWTKRINK